MGVKRQRIEWFGICQFENHGNCPGFSSTRTVNLICSCSCHHSTREETSMSDTTSSTSSRSTWTVEQTDYLKANASSGAKAIAVAVGRTEAQVRAKALKLGISLRQPGNKQGRRLKSETQTVDSI